MVALVRRRYQLLTVAATMAAVSATVLATGKEGPFEGSIFDAGVLLRGALLHRTATPSTTTAIVAMDWPSLRSPRTAAVPRALFAPVWGPLVDGLVAAGARAVVFDFVFEFSGNAFIPNYDRPFLASLARNRQHVVLARTAEVNPAPAFLAAAGGRGDPAAVALSEQVPARDGIVRTVHQQFPDEQGRMHPSLSGAALLRMGGSLQDEPVRYLPTGRLEETIPTWSLNDVLTCLDTPEGRDKLRQAVAGRAVFLGSVLPEEDRKPASDRLLLLYGTEPPPLPAAAPAPEGTCALPQLGPSSPQTGTVPGVTLHAAGTAAVLEGTALREASPGAVALFATLAAALATMAGLSLPPFAGIAALAAVLGGGLLLSWTMPLVGLWLPAGHAEAGSLGAMAAAHLVRYLAEERRRKHLQSLFGHYLAPQVVARMTEDGTHPELGGETRDITCMFADLSGFTALSGKLSPHDLLVVTNRFLACIVRAVDESGGYVDKFIGDAVMAFWNAPSDLPDHAIRAVTAAARAAEMVRHEAELAAGQGQAAFSVKIGLNSGPAVVGNVGAERRFNYTAIGATVNIASRLESLPGHYDCAVVVSEATARLAGDAWLFCEIDSVRVKGRDEPLTIFTPLVPRGPAEAPCRPFLNAWVTALGLYRAGRFAEAAGRWRQLPPLPTGRFGPAEVMAARAEKLAAAPPAAWSGVWSIAKG